jgi:hypothetical protein
MWYVQWFLCACSRSEDSQDEIKIIPRSLWYSAVGPRSLLAVCLDQFRVIDREYGEP